MLKASPSTLHCFADTEPYARSLARALNLPLAPVTVHRFPDGETLVRGAPAVGTQAFLLRALHNPNAKLIETLFAADALRRTGARRVVLVAPYLPYMRQDTVFTLGEPISQRVIADCLGRTFDHVITIEPHLHRTRRLRDVFPCDAVALSAAPILAGWIQRTGRRSLVVGPDEESAPWIRAIANTAHLPWIVGKKERLGDQRVRIQLPTVPTCARAVIVDDIASGGGTLAVAARPCVARGSQPWTQWSCMPFLRPAREIDRWEIARVAKRAGAPANVSAGVRLLRTVGDVVTKGEPLYDIHAQSTAQLEFGRAYAEAHPKIVRFGF